MSAVTNNPLLADLLLGAIFVVFALVAGRRGFYKSVMPLIVLVLAALCAVFLSSKLTAPVTERFYPKVEAQLFEKIDFSGLSEIDASASADKLMSLLPEEAAEKLEQLGLREKMVTALDDALQSLSESGEAKTETVVSTAAKKAFSGLVHILLFFVLFLVCVIVFSVVQHALSLVIKLPLVRQADCLLGAALGLVTCALLLKIVLWAAKLAGSTFFTDLAEGTKLLAFFVR